jgi:hypothetical protein
MKKLFYFGVFVLACLGVWATVIPSSWKTKVNLGSNYTVRAPVNLVGSSTQLRALPKAEVFSNATTTDPTQLDGGYAVQQEVNTEGVDEVLMSIQLKGGTATSTFALVQRCSFDGSSFSDVASSTIYWQDRTGTTTIAYLPKAIQVDPGTATTSAIIIPFNVKGCLSTRFIFWGEDVSTDPNDGVKAWIQIRPIESYSR